MRLFLKLNGFDLAASAEEKYATIIRVAASEMVIPPKISGVQK